MADKLACGFSQVVKVMIVATVKPTLEVILDRRFAWRFGAPEVSEDKAVGERRAIVAEFRRFARRFSHCRRRSRSAHLADLEASSPARGQAGQVRSNPSLRVPRDARPVRVDLGAVLLHDRAEGLPPLVHEAERHIDCRSRNPAVLRSSRLVKPSHCCSSCLI